MTKEKLNVSASNIVNVCIDNIDGVERSGRFYCYYSEEPIFFRSIHELFRFMEPVSYTHLEERTPLYEKYADIVVDQEGKDLEASLELLLETLKEKAK